MVSGEEAGRAFGGRYWLLYLVGEGTGARVHVAEDLTLRRRVAVKIFREELADDEGFLRRFEQEMRASAALRFPRLLPVYDWGLRPSPYLVTEHVAGGSLAAMLDAGHRLTPSQALVVGLEAARALVNIHGAGRAHRGLTPSSILFDSGARLFVSDLGLAPALAGAGAGPPEADAGPPEADAEAGRQHAEAEAGAGPPEAGAEADAGPPEADAGPPEAEAGSPRGVDCTPADKARDVYDLVLVLNEAVTGARAGAGETADASFVPSMALGPLQSVLGRATGADPSDRLDAAGLVEELLRVAALLPRPEPLPLVTAARPPEPRGAAGPTVPIPDPPPGPDRRMGPTVSERSAIPLDDAPRRRWPGLVLAAALVLGGAAVGAWAWLESRPDAVAVPDLAGRTRAAAAVAASDLGWEVNEILVRKQGAARGEVVRTRPAAGTALDGGATLDLFVSLGEPLVAVDGSVFGHTVPDATELLAERGLVVGGETPANDEAVPPGLVIGLDVGEGVYELEAGSEVGLLVSVGPADRAVPAVPEDGAPRAAAEALLAARLVPQEAEEFSPNVPEGSVIGYRPASGRMAAVGSIVEVLVSLGPPPPEPNGNEAPGGGSDGNEEPVGGSDAEASG